jgi:hypothetical protein
MFKKPSRSKNFRRKVEITDDEPTEIEQGIRKESLPKSTKY